MLSLESLVRIVVQLRKVIVRGGSIVWTPTGDHHLNGWIKVNVDVS